MLGALTAGRGSFAAGKADALCFAPLNKGALRAGGMQHADEMHWFAEVLGHRGTCVEFNVLEDAVDVARHIARSVEGRERATVAGEGGRRDPA